MMGGTPGPERSPRGGPRLGGLALSKANHLCSRSLLVLVSAGPVERHAPGGSEGRRVITRVIYLARDLRHDARADRLAAFP